MSDLTNNFNTSDLNKLEEARNDLRRLMNGDNSGRSIPGDRSNEFTPPPPTRDPIQEANDLRASTSRPELVSPEGRLIKLYEKHQNSPANEIYLKEYLSEYKEYAQSQGTEQGNRLAERIQKFAEANNIDLEKQDVSKAPTEYDMLAEKARTGDNNPSRRV